MRVNRRRFLGAAGAAAGMCAAGPVLRSLAGQPGADAPYERANTDWLARCRYGIGVHWTAQTVPRTGAPKPFQKAVADFNLDGFMAAVERAGADYVLFTAAHALQMLPAPNAVLDRILPGRTCERDLIAEMTDALAASGKHSYTRPIKIIGPARWSTWRPRPRVATWAMACNGSAGRAWKIAAGSTQSSIRPSRHPSIRTNNSSTSSGHATGTRPP